MQIQPAPYAQPYPVVNEGSQRSLVSERPTRLLHGHHHQSPSLSEESQRADGDSEAQIESKLSHPQKNVLSDQNCESGGAREIWSEPEATAHEQ